MVKILTRIVTKEYRDRVYITGDSGSGKSVLLRAIRSDLGEEAIAKRKASFGEVKWQLLTQHLACQTVNQIGTTGIMKEA